MADKFEEKVFSGLKKALLDAGTMLENCKCIGVAVSGGADSVSLLVALKNVLPESIRLKAVTVNHNIRPKEETCADAAFVQDFCLSLSVDCRRYDVPRGLVFEKAECSRSGIEDSARKLRYEKFEEFIESEKVDFLCLAHNKNDQLETVIMRFLQGSADLSGIPVSRKKFVRPMLEIGRNEIEEYLFDKNISYRTDSTNYETSMLRNRIRNILVPVLNDNFNGWITACENISSKSKRDRSFIERAVCKSMDDIGYNVNGNCVTFSSEKFYSLQKAVRDRILQKSVEVVGADRRISYAFINRWSDEVGGTVKASEFSSGIQFSLKDGIVKIEKKSKVATETGFSVIIEEPGKFFAGFLEVDVSRRDGGICIDSGHSSIFIPSMDFPFVFRSRQSGDKISLGNGDVRNVSGIMEGWKASGMMDLIPVVVRYGENGQEIKCIWGSLYGFKDWIVSG